MTLQLTLHRFHVALRSPLQTATTTITMREGVVLRLADGTGVQVEAECAPLPHFSPETLAACLDAATCWTTEPTPASADAWLARASTVTALPALQCAAETLAIRLARAHGTVLDGWPERLRQRVPVNALAANAEDARLRVDEGFSVLKIKVGADTLRNDVQRVQAIRRAVGDRITLRLDANQAWSLADAQLAVDLFVTERIALLEEPLRDPTPASLAAFRAYSAIPIGADESARDSDAIRALLDADAVDAVVLKPMLVGGPVTTLALAKLAHAHGKRIIITTSIDGPLATQMAIDVAARCPGTEAHGLATAHLFADTSSFQLPLHGALFEGGTP